MSMPPVNTELIGTITPILCGFVWCPFLVKGGHGCGHHPFGQAAFSKKELTMELGQGGLLALAASWSGYAVDFSDGCCDMAANGPADSRARLASASCSLGC